VAPHGKEWKHHFRLLLQRFLALRIFPADIEAALTASLRNPAASSCADEPLMRVLRGYDKRDEDTRVVEQIAPGGSFQLRDGRVFIRGEKLRKRYKATEVGTGLVYLFNALYEVRCVSSVKSA
jgi:hypothetical protein